MSGKKAARRTVAVLVFVLLAAALAILFLPWLLSTAPARALVLRRAEALAGARMEAGEWSLSWLRPLEASGVTYHDEAAGLAVTLEKVTISRGLWGLLRERDAGEVVLHRPDIVLRLPDPAPPLPPDRPAKAPAPPAAPASPPPAATPAAVGIPEARPWPAASGRLVVRGGRLLLKSSAGQVGLADIEGALDLTRAPPLLQVRLAGRQEGDQGRFTLEARWAPDEQGRLPLDALDADVQAQLAGWALAPLLRLVEGAGGPGGSGLLEADLRFLAEPGGSVSLRGGSSLADLQLWGTVLQGDRPVLDRIECSWDASWIAGGLTLEAFRLQAPFAELEAQGRLLPGALPEGEITGQADLARLAALFPRTLSLREGLQLDRGRAAFTLRSSGAGESPVLSLDSRVEELSGMLDGHPAALSAPVTLALEIEGFPDDWSVRKADFEAPFGALQAVGDSRDASLSGALDLEALLAEVAPFIDLGGWDARGTLKLQARLLRPEEGVQLSAALSGDNLSVNRDGQVYIDGESLNLSYEAAFHLDEEDVWVCPRAVATFSVPGLRGRALLRGLRLDPETGPAGVLQVGAGADLARLGALLGEDAQPLLSGRATVQGEWSFDAQGLRWTDATVEIEEGGFRSESVVYALPSLTARSTGEAHWDSRNLAVTEITADGLPGSLRGSLRVEDWEHLPAGLSLDLEWETALEDVLDALEGTEGIDRLSGARGALVARLAASSGGTGSWDLNADVSGTSLSWPAPGDGPAIEEEQVRLLVKAVVDESGLVRFDPLSLESGFLEVSAAGETLRDREQLRLRTAGTLRYDLEPLASLVARLAGLPVSAGGQAQRPFEADVPLDPEEWITGSASASFAADYLSGFGIRLEHLDVPFLLGDEVAGLVLEADLHGGRLAVHPRVQRTGGTLLLSFPDASKVLQGVTLTDAMADQLLARFHPVFKGATVLGGRVHLTFDRFLMPLDEKRRNDTAFSGELLLEDVELEASGWLRELSSLARMKGNRVRVGNHSIRFVCVDGRVETSPLKLTIDGHPVEISGWVGLDETLSYVVTLPVTEELVGREVYAHLRDATLSIPVRGTLSHPKLGRDEWREAVNGLLRQASTQALERGAERLLRRLLE